MRLISEMLSNAYCYCAETDWHTHTQTRTHMLNAHYSQCGVTTRQQCKCMQAQWTFHTDVSFFFFYNTLLMQRNRTQERLSGSAAHHILLDISTPPLGFPWLAHTIAISCQRGGGGLSQTTTSQAKLGGATETGKDENGSRPFQMQSNMACGNICFTSLQQTEPWEGVNIISKARAFPNGILRSVLLHSCTKWSIISLCNGCCDGFEISLDKYKDRQFYYMAHWRGRWQLLHAAG